MSKTWRNIPKGRPRSPRPPEKGGHKNLYQEALDETLPDLDELMDLELANDWDPFDFDDYEEY